MSNVTPAEARRYADYAIRVCGDTESLSKIDQCEDGTWAKFFYRIYRVPSRKEFTLRVCPDATDEERALAARILATMPGGGWAKYNPRAWYKRRGNGDYYTWHIFGGSPIDDPLVQLELEMMIDLTRGVSA